MGKVEPVCTVPATFKPMNEELNTPVVNDQALPGKENAAYNMDPDDGGCTPPPTYEETVITMNKAQEAEEEIDPWDLVMPPDTGKPWKGILYIAASKKQHNPKYCTS